VGEHLTVSAVSLDDCRALARFDNEPPGGEERGYFDPTTEPHSIYSPGDRIELPSSGAC
jgi:hypothetical protein